MRTCICVLCARVCASGCWQQVVGAAACAYNRWTGEGGGGTNGGRGGNEWRKSKKKKRMQERRRRTRRRHR